MSDLSTERLQAMLDASTGGRWAAEIIPGDIGPRCFVVIMDPSGAPDDDVDILADAYGVPDDAHLMALAPDLAREVLRLRRALAHYADPAEWHAAHGEPWRLRFNSSDLDDHGWAEAAAALGRDPEQDEVPRG